MEQYISNSAPSYTYCHLLRMEPNTTPSHSSTMLPEHNLEQDVTNVKIMQLHKIHKPRSYFQRQDHLAVTLRNLLV